MFAEDDLLPLSALQHLVFCERQAALIHLERIWADSVATVEGTHLHDCVHEEWRESRGTVIVARGLPLRSLRLGLAGQADVVEFHRVGNAGAGCRLPRRSGFYRPHPIEFKRGRPKRHRADEVQLCAQAVCLEEMTGVAVPRGALFYGKTRRRLEVELDDGLRLAVEHAASRLHEIWRSAVTPPPEAGPKCDECSLRDQCQPYVTRSSASAFVARLLDGNQRAPE